MQLLGVLFRFLAAYGYYFVFLASTLENFPVVGLAVPGEVIVVGAGVLAARDPSVSLVMVIVVASLGGIVGSFGGYVLGAVGGRSLIERLGARLGLDHERFEEAEKYFAAHGNKTVFLGRFAAGVKGFLPALAGASRMKFSAFAFWSVLGVVCWTVAAALLGYFFGESWPVLMRLVRGFGLGVLGILIIGIAIYIWFRRRRSE